MGVRVNIEYGYYEHDTIAEPQQRLIARFEYDGVNDSFLMFDMFENEFVPQYGNLSDFAKEKNDFLRPYLVDESGEFTTENTRIIGGTNIPAGAILPIITSLSAYPKVEVTVDGKRITPGTSRQDIMTMMYELKNKKIEEESKSSIHR